MAEGHQFIGERLMDYCNKLAVFIRRKKKRHITKDRLMCNKKDKMITEYIQIIETDIKELPAFGAMYL